MAEKQKILTFKHFEFILMNHSFKISNRDWRDVDLNDILEIDATHINRPWINRLCENKDWKYMALCRKPHHGYSKLDDNAPVSDIKIFYGASVNPEYFRAVTRLKKLLDDEKIPYTTEGNLEDVVKEVRKYSSELTKAAAELL